MKRGFGSDNHSGIHPKILESITRANQGHAPAYQSDEWCERAEQDFQAHFGPQARIFFVFNGTAANVLGLSALTESFHTVLVSAQAHLENDECGAPEKILGLKLKTIETPDGKLTPELLAPHIIRGGDQHFSQIKAISVTQPTELGTVYSLEETRRLVEFAKKHRLRLHMDGARLAQAAIHNKCNYRELTEGFDTLSFGGTKNGLLGGEAVVVLNPELGQNLKFHRKQFLQLPSKTRFVAVQFSAYLNGLWQEIARQQNDRARLLRKEIETRTSWRITQNTESNAVFVCIPKHQVAKLREHFFFYVWDEKTFECRLMTSWDTTEDDIRAFGGLISESSSADC